MCCQNKSASHFSKTRFVYYYGALIFRVGIGYREFVSILKNLKNEILNSFRRPYDDHKLSNAFCENINGKIRDYLSVSRGIANFTRFRKRVLYALNPKIFYSLSNVLSSDKKEGKKRGQYKKTRK